MTVYCQIKSYVQSYGEKMIFGIWLWKQRWKKATEANEMFKVSTDEKHPAIRPQL